MTPYLLAQETAGKLSGALMPDIGRFGVELVLCGMVVFVILWQVVRGNRTSDIYPRLTMLGIFAAMAVVVVQIMEGARAVSVGYAGFPALQIDHLGAVFKLIFLATGALTVLFIGRSREAYGREAELSVLMFGALAGMCYLASATDLLGFYLAFETVSYTGYMMAGFRTDSVKAAEAGGKYVIFGSVSSAVMLFGLTLIYGYTGSTQFDKIAEVLTAAPREPILLVAAVFVFGGFAFKAAAFPFQFWCPDVYEGAPAPIAGFLAVASKAAVFAVIVRVLGYHGAIGDATPHIADLLSANSTVVQQILVAASVATMTWGNLAALRQTNIQRMLAYSSIAHAGYLLMTAAVLAPGNQGALGGIVFYFVIYLCMNLGAFYIVTLLRRDCGNAEISSLRGLGFRRPALAFCLAVMLFSLTGLPPTAGFVGKFLLFAPVLEGGWYVLAAVGLINGAISLYYYAKPMREMFLTEPELGAPERIVPDGADLALAALLTAPLLIFGVFGWDHLTEFARSATPIVAGFADMAVAIQRQHVIEVLNDALSCEYHSFIGHALASNPFITPGCEKDVEFLETLREDENANSKALLVQMGRYRAGPTLKAFRFWKEDLNFLGIDWLIVRAAEIAKSEVARIEASIGRLPGDDMELAATFQSILETKRRHASELAVLAAKRQKERDARRAVSFKATAIPLKKGAAAKPAAAASAPAAAGAAKSPPLPGAPKAPTPPGAPKALSAPKPPGAPSAPKPPSAGPKPPSPPLPPGAPKPPGPPKPPGAPSPPKPPAAKAPAEEAAPAATEATTVEALPASDGPTLAGPPGPNYKPGPPKPYVPKRK